MKVCTTFIVSFERNNSVILNPEQFTVTRKIHTLHYMDWGGMCSAGSEWGKDTPPLAVQMTGV